MSYVATTPQRPLPGGYLQTPAPQRQVGGMQLMGGQNQLNTGQPQGQQQGQNQLAQQGGNNGANSSDLAAQPEQPPLARAAKAINECLVRDRQYPELESYLGQGVSSEYEIQDKNRRLLAPFQKLRTYPVPDRVFEQLNHLSTSSSMGLFAEIHHAFVWIDNAIYLWDYTHPDPQLIGYEDQPNAITAAALVTPRAGVFIPKVNKLLVLATTSDILLLGVEAVKQPNGFFTLTLYQTKMSISIRGLDVKCITGSKTGRIFFTGRSDNDVYEAHYQQEDGWFSSGCQKANHTANRLSTLLPKFDFSQSRGEIEHTKQLEVDDNRNLLYTLSTKSAIRVFHMRPPGSLNLQISKPLQEVLTGTAHITTQPEVLSQRTTLVSIHAISSNESTKIHLVAVTNTGCRIYLSATGSYGSIAGSGPPSSMQVHHIKLPPSRQIRQPQQTQPQPSQTQQAPQNRQGQIQGGQQGQLQGQNQTANATPATTTSFKSVTPTTGAYRFAPGFFFDLYTDPASQQPGLFISAPDTARIKYNGDPAIPLKFYESGIFLPVSQYVVDVGIASAPFSAAPSPLGFANELAVQFDEPSMEIALLSNEGVDVYRRQRLVDIYADALRSATTLDGKEKITKQLLQRHGRVEGAATNLAVACGQGLGVTPDSRLANIVEPAVLDYARSAFIDFGGKPVLTDGVTDVNPSLDQVRLSARQEAVACYMSRLVRSFWYQRVIRETTLPEGGLAVVSPVDLENIESSQRDLSRLKEFLAQNKSTIAGLSGPEALTRVSSKQEEVALQAEHRGLHALSTLLSDMIEGIAFVQTLFKERVNEIVLSLSEELRQQVRDLTYEVLFTNTRGKVLAKELVKAIVNRNIANGGNVEYVADSLRRRCGNFCSPSDVIVFKAQDLVKKAQESGLNSEVGRNLLNESMKLYKQVAGSLGVDQLQWAVQQYIQLQFYAGAIELCLFSAQEGDRGNRALSWVHEDKPMNDAREAIFQQRKVRYNMVHETIEALDDTVAKHIASGAQGLDVLERRKEEAYAIVDESPDEVFQSDLYDWYVSKGRADQLLEIKSPFVVAYLQRKGNSDVAHADLLCRYYNMHNRAFDAATVQCDLARSTFDLSLDQRIQYLSRAKTTGVSFATGTARPNRQRLLKDISDLLDIANIQDDILQRIKVDERLNDQSRAGAVKKLDGQILSLTELFNEYSDNAGYIDINILIYHAADHNSRTDIRDAWAALLQKTHEDAVKANEAEPYEIVIDTVRNLGGRLELSDSSFPIQDLLPMLIRYSLTLQKGMGAVTWPIDVFMDLHVPFESLYFVLEEIYYEAHAPFDGSNRKIIAGYIVYTIRRWFEASPAGRGTSPFGALDIAASLSAALGVLISESVLDRDHLEAARVLKGRIDGLIQ